MTDIPALANIASACFSDDIFWQVPRLSYRYWNVTLASGSVETWLWLVGGQPVAFSVLVVDLDAWMKEKRSLGYGRSTRLLALISHPTLIVRKMQSTARLILRSDNRASGCHATAQRNLPPVEAVVAHSQLIHYGGIYCNSALLAWGELAGVLPGCRQFGLAFDILRFNEARARELGRAAIGGVVEARREAWGWIHERLNYQPALRASHRGQGRTTYIKLLDPTRGVIGSDCRGAGARREVVVTSVN